MLGPSELELVWSAIANDQTRMDPGFVRKLTSRWEKVVESPMVLN